MAIGRTFKESLQKALRSLETGRHGLGADGKDRIDPGSCGEDERENLRHELRTRLRWPKADRLFDLRFAMLLGIGVEELRDITGIDPWFLHQIEEIVSFESELRGYSFPDRTP
jgi:carbamoyl-phosphate synthase large subunit